MCVRELLSPTRRATSSDRIVSTVVLRVCRSLANSSPSTSRRVFSSRPTTFPGAPAMTTIQQGSLLDVLKKKMRQTKEEMERYKEECEDFHKKLQMEVMRREEVRTTRLARRLPARARFHSRVRRLGRRTNRPVRRRRRLTIFNSFSCVGRSAGRPGRDPSRIRIPASPRRNVSKVLKPFFSLSIFIQIVISFGRW